MSCNTEKNGNMWQVQRFFRTNPMLTFKKLWSNCCTHLKQDLKLGEDDRFLICFHYEERQRGLSRTLRIFFQYLANKIRN